MSPQVFCERITHAQALQTGPPGSALAVLAQPAGGPSPQDGPGMQQNAPEHRTHRHERMKAHMAQRTAELKADLKLTPEQESNWNA